MGCWQYTTDRSCGTLHPGTSARTSGRVWHLAKDPHDDGRTAEMSAQTLSVTPPAALYESACQQPRVNLQADNGSLPMEVVERRRARSSHWGLPTTTMWPAALAEAACAYKNDPHALVVCFFLTKPPIFPLQWI